MKLLLKKIEETPNSTASVLYIDGAFCCFILEDGHRDAKIAGETRIPAGTYPIVQRRVGKFFTRYSKKWNDAFVPELLNVPGFKYILIHLGNTVSDTRGCLITGNAIAYNDDLFIIPAGQSTAAYRKLYRALDAAFARGEDVSIEVQR